MVQNALAPSWQALLVGWGLAGYLGGCLGDSSDSRGPVGGPVTQGQLAMSTGVGCVVRDGEVFCWGKPNRQLGYLDRDEQVEWMPIGSPVAGVADALMVSVGYDHACAVLSDGTVMCWGGNSAGHLGDGTLMHSEVAVQVSDIDDVVEVAAGTAFTCARTATGEVWCWGTNNYGQLGNGEDRASVGGTLLSPTPVLVQDLDDAVSIDVGATHACAVTASDELRCWGQEDHQGGGHFGAVPATIEAPANLIAVGAGDKGTCVLTSDGTALCRGAGFSDSGAASEHEALTPVPGVGDAQTLAVRGFQACAVLNGGAVTCWGTEVDFSQTVPADAISISAGYGGACVGHDNGTVTCWESGCQETFAPNNGLPAAEYCN